MFSCRSAWSCAYSDAILFAGGVVAFPQVCRGALALHFTPAQLLLQLLGFGQLLPQSWTFIAHVTTQQAGHLHWDTQVFLICLRIPYMQSFHWHSWMDITLTQIDIICLIKGHNLLPILWQKKTENTNLNLQFQTVFQDSEQRNMTQRNPLDRFVCDINYKLELNPLSPSSSEMNICQRCSWKKPQFPSGSPQSSGSESSECLSFKVKAQSTGLCRGWGGGQASFMEQNCATLHNTSLFNAETRFDELLQD